MLDNGKFKISRRKQFHRKPLYFRTKPSLNMSDTQERLTFKFRQFPSLLKSTAKAWMSDDPWRLSAVVAFYAMLSLPGLVVVIINGVGAIWGEDIVTGTFSQRVGAIIGPQAADTITNLVQNTRDNDLSLPATIIGLAILMFGSTGIFFHLQRSLNQIWEIKADSSGSGFKRILIDRALGFGFVLIVGALLLVSLMLTSAVSIMDRWVSGSTPDAPHFGYGINLLLSMGIVTVLFALIYRFLPDARVQWRTVWIGAAFTAVLFTIGKFILEWVFGLFNPGSLYGATGSVVLILLWVWLSGQILFFGAEFIWVCANRYGPGIRPSPHTVKFKKQEIGDEKKSKSHLLED